MIKNYRCRCGACLDIDDGVLCRTCFVNEHAKKPTPKEANAEQLRAWISDPAISTFFESVQKEIAYQRLCWEELDKTKNGAHWFWLTAHLTSKAFNAPTLEKRKHHIVTAAANLFLWLESELAIGNPTRNSAI